MNNVKKIKYSIGSSSNIKHAGRKEVVIILLAEECRAWTYMLPILEEKPGERAVKSLTDEPDESTSPPPSGVSANGSIGLVKSAVGASGAESLFAYSNSI